MNPILSQWKEENNELTFVLSETYKSVANDIRRTILSDIPIFVFKTFPHEDTLIQITENTTRLNNEILKQRLSCVPIHISDLTKDMSDFILEINVENKTTNILMITTEHFKIKNIKTNTYLSKEEQKLIFPPYTPLWNTSEYYTHLVSLKPRISDEILGEKLHLTCPFSISTCKENGMFNVASTCSYGFTIDPKLQEKELAKVVKQWKEEKMSAEEIESESKNWLLLKGLTCVKKDSYDFIIETLGIYSNSELLQKSCEIIISKLELLIEISQTQELEIKKSINTLPNSYDIVLQNEDYTIGLLLQDLLYNEFIEKTKKLEYCGFKKFHPHDDYSIVRVSYIENVSTESIYIDLQKIISDGISIFKKIIAQIK
jgi:DNA-directed RNA polymerase subunit L